MRASFALIADVADIQYSTVLAILYASYVPSQIPSNMVGDGVSGVPQNTHKPPYT